MYLQIGNNKGRKYLSIVQGYRDPVTKKIRHKTIKSFGYLDTQIPSPISEELPQKWSSPDIPDRGRVTQLRKLISIG